MRCKDVAQKWNVSLWTLSRLRRLRRENQSLDPKPKGNGPNPKLEPYKDLIQQIIDKNPDSTLEDIRRRLPIKVCVATVYNMLASMGISFKKTVYASEQNRPDVVENRRAWFARLKKELRRRGVSWDAVVFVDETFLAAF